MVAQSKQPEVLGQGQYRVVRLCDLTTDGRFNRPVSGAHERTLAGEFSPAAFHVLALWEREDKALVILDGQHRVGAARLIGVPEDTRCIPAIIYTGLTLDQAAWLFVRLNASKLVTAYDKYKALLTAGESETTAIDSIIRSHDLVAAGGGQGDGSVRCIEAVRRLYRLGEPEGAVLGHSLATLQRAWGAASEAYSASIVRGVGLYFHEHRDTEPDTLAAALVRGPGAPINLIGWAKTVAGTQRMPMDRAIAEVIESRVMKRRNRSLRSA